MAFRDLGLSDGQERVYRLLVAEPDLAASDLAARLDLPRDAVDTALTGLAALCLVRVDLRRPAGVRLFNPKVAVTQLIEQVEDDLLRQHRRVGDTRAELDTLAGPAPGTTVSGGVERLEDLEAVRERLEELAFYTRDSVFSIQPGGPLSSASLRAGQPLDERGLRRGVDMRIVYDRSILDDEDSVRYVRNLAAHGARIRLTAESLERLVMMDEAVAVVPIDPGNSGRGALVVREPGLVAGFARLFAAAWADATPPSWPDDPAGHDADQISDEDRQVLLLLASGRTDESVARQLDLSVRHLRRRVARLMERLSASSRFEAGVEAARRGWI